MMLPPTELLAQLPTPVEADMDEQRQNQRCHQGVTFHQAADSFGFHDGHASTMTQPPLSSNSFAGRRHSFGRVCVQFFQLYLSAGHCDVKRRGALCRFRDAYCAGSYSAELCYEQPNGQRR
jgi:hypothetical protein